MELSAVFSMSGVHNKSFVFLKFKEESISNYKNFEIQETIFFFCPSQFEVLEIKITDIRLTEAQRIFKAKLLCFKYIIKLCNSKRNILFKQYANEASHLARLIFWDNVKFALLILGFC